MPRDGYGEFCPISKACEVVEPRWTLLVLRELWEGASRFNDLRRGLPRMSPTLLSTRLKEMERRGLVVRATNGPGEVAYRTTPLADELRPIVFALGQWADRHLDADVKLEQLDARVLMWNMRRRVDAGALPASRRSVIRFTYPEQPEAERDFWLVARPGEPVDLCLADPGFDVDLLVTASLKAMTAAWMGYSDLRGEVARGRIVFEGDRRLTSTLTLWMVRSPFAAA